MANKTSIYTKSGHKLTRKESAFIDALLETGNATEAYRRAYKIKPVVFNDTDTEEIRELKEKRKKKQSSELGSRAYALQNKSYIAEEIIARQEQIRQESMISITEIYDYLARVVRGEEKDQFGLEVSIAERTRAATELLKRFVDMPAKLQEKESPEVKITLDWNTDKNLDVIDADVKKKDDVTVGMLTTQVGD